MGPAEAEPVVEEPLWAVLVAVSVEDAVAEPVEPAAAEPAEETAAPFETEPVFAALRAEAPEAEPAP